MKRRRPEGMTSFPRHLSNCVPQTISLRCFNWSHIIRQMAMFTDCPLGSRLVSWQVELPTPERLGGWLHAVEASKIQIVCRKFVRMSGCPSMVQLLHSNGFSMIFYLQFSTTAWTLLDTKACLHHSSPDFTFRPKSGPRSPQQYMLRLPAGQSGKLKSTCWWSWTGFRDLSRRHWCYFVSSNPWKPFKHIET